MSQGQTQNKRFLAFDQSHVKNASEAPGGTQAANSLSVLVIKH
jgi:hypothetical protein